MPSDRPAVITFSNVALGYGSKTVLSGLSFSINDGDLLALVGPNGAGKTTILRALLGTLPPKSGEVTRERNLRFGYVPQRTTLDLAWPLDSVSVVAMGAYDRIGVLKRAGAQARESALLALDQVGLGDLSDHRFSALSGGQKQRVLIARALIGKPSVLVLDEPTDGMDLVSSTSILGLVRALHATEGLTVIVVSHQLNEVANYVQRLALVTEGKFQIGLTEDVLTEENLSDLYGIPVEVDEVAGKRLIFPGRRTEEDPPRISQR
ncbi:MAG: metal ABC transporter ATP-binding protein [Gemmatimonadota bacterium]